LSESIIFNPIKLVLEIASLFLKKYKEGEVQRL